MGDFPNARQHSPELMARVDEAEARRLDSLREIVAARVDVVVELAKTGWDQERPMLTLSFPPDVYSSPIHNPGPEFGPITRESWNDVLARIALIGWELHTWTVITKADAMVPVPLFVRPTLN